MRCDAVLLIAFGGPERMEDVRLFLAQVLRGRPVPPARVEEVVRHYEAVGGRSPLNEITFRQGRELEALLRAAERPLRVYVGMRNWHPFLHETLRKMAADGVRSALGFIMTAQQNDASWDRYKRDVAEARAVVGEEAPAVEFTPGWHAHPLFIETMAETVRTTLDALPRERRSEATVVFTAHSIPIAMAAQAPYVAQIEEGARLVSSRLGLPRFEIAYQSRSGSPHEAWLEPDILQCIRACARAGRRDLVAVPIGFLGDHVEVLYDLDIEARQLAESLGLCFVRAPTVGVHPSFIRLMADVVRECLDRDD
jgi:protoporphyrin/coproporphyrin ferrochelatase